MGLRTKIDRYGQVKVVGLTKSFQKYENDIRNGKIPCPYKVEHRDKDGNLITTKPIPLSPTTDKPKMDLFNA